ncbi:MAG: HU family DNA-binding protein [Klebsiella grimontii]|nr:HU family DNA-binding protein [Klebsiella grimontii]
MALTKAEMSEYLFDKLGLSKRRNPKTGEDIPITARRVVTFRPGQKLKSRVENASPRDK